MTAKFDRDGVRFMYPENWRLDDEPQGEGLVCALSLEAPSGALWTLNVEQGHRDLRQLAAEVVKAMSQEYEELESEPRETPLPGGHSAVGFEMHFYCMDMVAKAVVQCCHWGERTVMLMTQAEAREHDQLAPIFEAITTSLLAAPETG